MTNLTVRIFNVAGQPSQVTIQVNDKVIDAGDYEKVTESLGLRPSTQYGLFDNDPVTYTNGLGASVNLEFDDYLNVPMMLELGAQGTADTLKSRYHAVMSAFIEDHPAKDESVTVEL